MLSDNSNKIRNVKGYRLLNAGGAQGRPRLLHNGPAQKGGTNSKGTGMKYGEFKKSKFGDGPKLPGKPGLGLRPGDKGTEGPGQVKKTVKAAAPKHPNAKTFTDGKGNLRQIGTGKIIKESSNKGSEAGGFNKKK